ncbi:hypothetical protein HELRODRAFT_169337 [Helobdella robusta]|uniref:Uncharacterized protein n=1 Tax=Helobdella robusta TaxID=6412 RepID=T1F1T0_HELRO|nr:hypothetical protein HELRODRAFT_169337 [Helobdella robusta]ESO08483.1 hypothetical protein HELRODRAFT_169337 [Helobdella robusta]
MPTLPTIATSKTTAPTTRTTTATSASTTSMSTAVSTSVAASENNNANAHPLAPVASSLFKTTLSKINLKEKQSHTLSKPQTLQHSKTAVTLTTTSASFTPSSSSFLSTALNKSTTTTAAGANSSTTDLHNTPPPSHMHHFRQKPAHHHHHHYQHFQQFQQQQQQLQQQQQTPKRQKSLKTSWYLPNWEASALESTSPSKLGGTQKQRPFVKRTLSEINNDVLPDSENEPNDSAESCKNAENEKNDPKTTTDNYDFNFCLTSVQPRHLNVAFTNASTAVTDATSLELVKAAPPTTLTSVMSEQTYSAPTISNSATKTTTSPAQNATNKLIDCSSAIAAYDVHTCPLCCRNVDDELCRCASNVAADDIQDLRPDTYDVITGDDPTISKVMTTTTTAAATTTTATLSTFNATTADNKTDPNKNVIKILVKKTSFENDITTIITASTTITTTTSATTSAHATTPMLVGEVLREEQQQTNVVLSETDEVWRPLLLPHVTSLKQPTHERALCVCIPTRNLMAQKIKKIHVHSCRR